MRIKKVLLLGALMVLFVGFSGSNETTARDISPECRAEIIEAFETCRTECGRDLRCFIRCVITNIPSCLR